MTNEHSNINNLSPIALYDWYSSAIWSQSEIFGKFETSKRFGQGKIWLLSHVMEFIGLSARLNISQQIACLFKTPQYESHKAPQLYGIIPALHTLPWAVERLTCLVVIYSTSEIWTTFRLRSRNQNFGYQSPPFLPIPSKHNVSLDAFIYNKTVLWSPRA